MGLGGRGRQYPGMYPLILGTELSAVIGLGPGDARFHTFN